MTQLGPTNKILLYLTEHFSYRSSRGNEYILIGYHYDVTIILVTPLRNRHVGKLIEAWIILNEYFLQQE